MPGTPILVTRFLSESGIAEAVDFMPIERPQTVSDRRRIVRVVRGIRGEVELEARVEPASHQPDAAGARRRRRPVEAHGQGRGRLQRRPAGPRAPP
jgi:hypothetical protein